MRSRRIHTESPLEPENSLQLSGAPAHYLSRVLRLTVGQPVVLFNGDGHDYAAEIESVDKQRVGLRIQSRLPAPMESQLRVTVVQGISRGERMDLTLQKCTELGAVAFQPVLSERVEVRIRPEKLQRRMQHWRSVVIAACEQSGRACVPEVLPPVDLGRWLAQPAEGLRLVLDPAAEQAMAGIACGNHLQLAVGPEGGFSAAELAQMKLAGVRGVSLGPRILRTETAGPAALAVLQASQGDLA